MMRRMALALAAVAVVMAGPASTAAAMHGGFGGGHGGHFGGGHFGGFSHPGGGFNISHPGMAAAHAFHGDHFRHFDRDRFGHDRFFRHRFGHRFVFFGAGFPYGYYNYDDCYTRVWTRWGWRLRYVCY